jgi:hypothetical protein
MQDPDPNIPPTLQPSLALLVKLGSIARHVEEAVSTGGHPFDVVATRALLGDAELEAWMAAADELHLLPVARQ